MITDSTDLIFKIVWKSDATIRSSFTHNIDYSTPLLQRSKHIDEDKCVDAENTIKWTMQIS